MTLFQIVDNHPVFTFLLVWLSFEYAAVLLNGILKARIRLQQLKAEKAELNSQE